MFISRTKRSRTTDLVLHAVDAGQKGYVSQDEDDAEVDQEDAAVALHVPVHIMRKHHRDNRHSV